jgi:hypothetical protein
MPLLRRPLYQRNEGADEESERGDTVGRRKRTVGSYLN